MLEKMTLNQHSTADDWKLFRQKIDALKAEKPFQPVMEQ